MPDTGPKEIVPKGFIKEIGMQVKLILRLMGDSRVSLFLKALPVGTLVYLVAPDLIPLVPFDDLAVIGMGLYLFIELCPQAVVEEHRQALQREVLGNANVKGEVIDGEFRDVGENADASDDADADSNTTASKGV